MEYVQFSKYLDSADKKLRILMTEHFLDFNVPNFSKINHEFHVCLFRNHVNITLLKV